MADKPDLSVPQDSGLGKCGTPIGSSSARLGSWRAACSGDSFVEYWQKPEELAHYARAYVDIEYTPSASRSWKASRRVRTTISRNTRSTAARAWRSSTSRSSSPPTNRDDAAKTAFADKVIAERVCTRQERGRGACLRLQILHGSTCRIVVEPSAGVDRMMPALICNAYEEQLTDDKGKRTPAS